MLAGIIGSGLIATSGEVLDPADAPSSLTATVDSESQVTLTWPDVGNETGYEIERRTGAGAWGALTSKAENSVSHVDSGLTPATNYTYRIRGTNLDGDSAWVESAEVTTLEFPPGWTLLDIGSPSGAGSASYSGGVFTINGVGNDIFDTSDQFTFLHKGTISGDGKIQARVASFTSTVHDYAKAGVMLRETLNANSEMALMCWVPRTPGRRMYMYRNSTGGTTVDSPIDYGATPLWVEVERASGTIYMRYSSDGSTWTTMQSIADPTGGADLYAGMAVTPHDAADISTATFDNVTVTV